MGDRTATLSIGTWSSSCSACGAGADPRETHHMKRLGYDGGGTGCGARFVAVTSSYGPAFADMVREMRPDLPYEDEFAGVEAGVGSGGTPT